MPGASSSPRNINPPSFANPEKLDGALNNLELTVRRRLDGLLQGNHLDWFQDLDPNLGRPDPTTRAMTCVGWIGR